MLILDNGVGRKFRKSFYFVVSFDIEFREEIEMVFWDVLPGALLSDGNPWINSIGATDPHDDSSSILSLEKKNYMGYLKKNHIVLFDFLCFFFGLWYWVNVVKLAKVIEGVKKGRNWINVICREVEKSNSVNIFSLIF